MNRAVRGLGAAALVVALGACGTTTLVSGPSTTVVGATTTAPTGTPDELLDRLLRTTYTLSTAIAEGGSRQVLAEIDSLWRAISSQLPRTEFVDDTGYQIELMRNAVERRRPADADKAALRIGELIATKDA